MTNQMTDAKLLENQILGDQIAGTPYIPIRISNSDLWLKSYFFLFPGHCDGGNFNEEEDSSDDSSTYSSGTGRAQPPTLMFSKELESLRENLQDQVRQHYCTEKLLKSANG